MLRVILAASLTESATAVSIAAVTFSEPANASAARSLAVLAVFFTNSRAASGTSMLWRFLKASVMGAKASLTLSSMLLVSVIGVSPSSDLSYGLTPSGLARGKIFMPRLMVRRNINVASRYHEIVIDDKASDLPDPTAVWPRIRAGPPPEARRPRAGPGPARYCARARRCRGSCRRHRGHGREAALRRGSLSFRTGR